MHFRFALLTQLLRVTTFCTTASTTPAVGKVEEGRRGEKRRTGEELAQPSNPNFQINQHFGSGQGNLKTPQVT